MMVRIARLLSSAAIMLLAASAVGRADETFKWTANATDEGAIATYANEGADEDRTTLVSVECRKGDSKRTMIFWQLGAEGDVDKKVNVAIKIDSFTTAIPGTGSSKMDGVGVDTSVDVSDPLFGAMIAGKSMDFGIEGRDSTKRTISLKGSGKAVKLLQQTCG
jgi:hypothetical protein